MNASINSKLHKLNHYFHTTNPDMTDKERLFSRVIKLNEEVGELCEAVLTEHDRNQRHKDKDIDFDAELADITICLLLLAQDRNKDIWVEVDSKLEKLMRKCNLD